MQILHHISPSASRQFFSPTRPLAMQFDADTMQMRCRPGGSTASLSASHLHQTASKTGRCRRRVHLHRPFICIVRAICIMVCIIAHDLHRASCITRARVLRAADLHHMQLTRCRSAPRTRVRAQHTAIAARTAPNGGDGESTQHSVLSLAPEQRTCFPHRHSARLFLTNVNGLDRDLML